MKRIKLADRVLPNYTTAEEWTNTITHIVGGSLSILGLVLAILRACSHHNVMGLVTSIIYGCCLIALYTMSSVYHGLRPGSGKKVMQILDHCTIYFLIAGTYTPIALTALAPSYPWIGWGLFGFEWALCALGAALTAIDLKKFNIFSMICYIGMGWAIIPFISQIFQVMEPAGFWFLLAGGISYTVGAILYGIGSKVHWMHSVFHIMVLLGSILQYFTIYFYVL